MPASHRRPAPPELIATAHHEAGHAIAVTVAFRNAVWLPHPAPALPVHYVEITEDAPGHWSGGCLSEVVYSTAWPLACITEAYNPLMESQIVVNLGGGLAEAMFRGETREREALAFAELYCSMDDDLEQASDVLDAMHRLTGYRLHAKHFVERTLVLLQSHWYAVKALAAALVLHGRVEGAEIEAIIDHAMSAVKKWSAPDASTRADHQCAPR
jgi:hypothetical protein